MRQFILALSIVTFCSCVPQRQWRTKPYYAEGGAGAKTEERFVIPLSPDRDTNRMYSLAFVEFKNNGELDAPAQLDEALHAIDDADQRSGHHALVIAFIHGWKNNARPDKGNVLDFRMQINRIAAFVCQDDKDKCGVVGIYLAWNGDVIDRSFNSFRQGSYFNRRDVAAQVAKGQMGDALFKIMRRVKDGEGRSANRSVVVGHSFGGLVLEGAIKRQMTKIAGELHDELSKTAKPAAYRRADLGHLPALDYFANLVVLINEAASSANAVELLNDFRKDFGPDLPLLARPLILSVASQSDLATKAVLPIAETVFPPRDRQPTPPELLKSLGLDQKKVFTTAPAHTPQLQSHHTKPCTDPACDDCRKDPGNVPVTITLPAYAPENGTKNDKILSYCVERDTKAWNSTPYWIFQIPPEIVPDHSTIFTDRFTDFLTPFLNLEGLWTAQPAPQNRQIYTAPKS